MAFLRQKDYLKQIRNDNLQVIIEGDDEVRKETELAAQAEIESYLSQRYDTPLIFTNLYEYDPAATYNTGDLIMYPDCEDDIYNALEDNITGETPDDAPTKWSKGDTRSTLIKMHLIDLTLYHLHSRINPRNIPDFRIARRDDCISWLKMVAKGQLNVNLPVITDPDKAGLKVKWASNDKFNHNY